MGNDKILNYNLPSCSLNFASSSSITVRRTSAHKYSPTDIPMVDEKLTIENYTGSVKQWYIKFL
jgi:hypothetical protein